MTQEQKAKAYDEAIERAKNFIENGDESERTIAESIFAGIMEESEDERIRRELIDFVKSRGGFKGDWITWLEKQGEQKLALSEEDEINRKAFPNHYGGQKLADKVEPKFNVGDWIVRGKTIAQILDIQEQYYVGLDINGNDFTSSRFLSNDKIHLWTIQDAKDGDVLAAHECIVLFKEIDGLNIKCHCTYHFMNNPSFYVNTLQNKSAFHPATKEQRDTLIKAIADAGYEWDAEKKELKKIEQKPTWSEEDEYTLEGIIDEIQANKNTAANYEAKTYDRFLSFLKSLRPQSHWKPTDEQIKALTFACIKNVGIDKSSIKALYDLKEQLKKLREE